MRKRIEKSKFDTFIPVICKIMFDLNSYLVYIRHHFCSFLVSFATYFCAGSCLLPLVFNCFWICQDFHDCVWPSCSLRIMRWSWPQSQLHGQGAMSLLTSSSHLMIIPVLHTQMSWPATCCRPKSLKLTTFLVTPFVVDVLTFGDKRVQPQMQVKTQRKAEKHDVAIRRVQETL